MIIVHSFNLKLVNENPKISKNKKPAQIPTSAAA